MDVLNNKELLRRFRIKTIIPCLHVAKEKLVVIKRSLVSLCEQGEIVWYG
jgi:hypothetical protein